MFGFSQLEFEAVEELGNQDAHFEVGDIERGPSVDQAHSFPMQFSDHGN